MAAAKGRPGHRVLPDPAGIRSLLYQLPATLL